ncbi:MAG: DUF1064 domain-containing protein [Methanoregula sp.]
MIPHWKKGNGPRDNKYRAKKTIIDNIPFDSLTEGRRYLQLKTFEKLGELKILKVHPEFNLLEDFTDTWTGKKVRGLKYTGDFLLLYTGSDHRVCEDVKGVKTRDFQVRWKLAKFMYPEVEFRLWPQEKAKGKRKV